MPGWQVPGLLKDLGKNRLTVPQPRRLTMLHTKLMESGLATPLQLADVDCTKLAVAMLLQCDSADVLAFLCIFLSSVLAGRHVTANPFHHGVLSCLVVRCLWIQSHGFVSCGTLTPHVRMFRELSTDNGRLRAGECVAS